MMKLSTYKALDAVTYFLKTAKWPFLITLILGIPASLMGGNPAKIFISALSGQLAITLLKLFTYFALAALSFAVVLRGWPWLFRVIHSTADNSAGIAFMTAACAAGVSAGLVGGMLIELAWWKALLAASILVLEFILISIVLWLAAVVSLKSLPASNIWKGLFVTIIALMLTAFFSASFYCEKWTEVGGQVPSKDCFLCQSLSKLHSMH